MWGVLGAVAEAIDSLPVGTGVTSPIIRVHRAIVVQAAATAARQLSGRFVLGVGTGENLNEYIVGERWPPHDQRLEMLVEAIEVIRLLWGGGTKTHRGDHYTVEDARVFTLSRGVAPIAVAAGGQRAAAAAGHYGDALMSTAPDPSLLQGFGEGNEGEVAGYYGQIDVCYGWEKEAALTQACEQWPNGGLPGELIQALPTPAHFEHVAELVAEEDLEGKIVCGSDLDEYIEMIEEYADAGFDHIQIHNIGPEQDEFIDFFADDVAPSSG